MKILITESKLRKVQFKYLDFLFDGMYEVEQKKYPESRFWKKDDNVVLDLEESGDMWVYFKIWDNFSGLFSLDYDETQQVMKEWLEENLNLEGITPQEFIFRWKTLLDEHLT